MFSGLCCGNGYVQYNTNVKLNVIRGKQGIVGQFCILLNNFLVKTNIYYFVVPYDSLYCCLTHICYESGKSTLNILKIYI